MKLVQCLMFFNAGMVSADCRLLYLMVRKKNHSRPTISFEGKESRRCILGGAKVMHIPKKSLYMTMNNSV